MNSVLRITLLAALPAGLGLSVLAGPILRFLFPARLMEAAIITPVLRIMGISTILVAVTTPVNSVLQATGHEKLTLGVMLTLWVSVRVRRRAARYTIPPRAIAASRRTEAEKEENTGPPQHPEQFHRGDL